MTSFFLPEESFRWEIRMGEISDKDTNRAFQQLESDIHEIKYE